MWDALRRRAGQEAHPAVVSEVAGAADRLLAASPVEAWDLLTRVVQHAPDTADPSSAASTCTVVVGFRWVWEGDPRAEALLSRLTDLDTFGREGLRSLLHELRVSGAFTSDRDVVRRRTRELCEELVRTGAERLASVDDDGPSDDQLADMRAALELLDWIAHQIYFASGAHDAKAQQPGGPVSATAARLADEYGAVIADLGAVPAAPLTHTLMEFVEFVLDERPSWAVEALHAILTKGGQAGGYATDSMGIQAMVRVMARLLADHRSVLRDPGGATAIRETLDVFVDTGWPAAHQLVFRLEQIFR